MAAVSAPAGAVSPCADAAIDSMSGMTSQPSLGAIAANLRGSELDTGIDMGDIGSLNTVSFLMSLTSTSAQQLPNKPALYLILWKVLGKCSFTLRTV